MASHHSQSAIASTAFSDDPSRQVEPIFKGQNFVPANSPDAGLHGCRDTQPSVTIHRILQVYER